MVLRIIKMKHSTIYHTDYAQFGVEDNVCPRLFQSLSPTMYSTAMLPPIAPAKPTARTPAGQSKDGK